MSFIPIALPDVPVLWHNAVADIEPTSRYGLDRDLGSVNSTLCYVNPSEQALEATLLAPCEHETESNIRSQSAERAVPQAATPLDAARYQPALAALRAAGQDTAPLEAVLARSPRHYVGTVVLEPGPQVVRYHTRVPSRPDAAGVYEYSLSVPMGAAPLQHGARLGVLVLLPCDAPGYEVELLDWSREDERAAEVIAYGAGQVPKLGGRAAVAWSWVRGPSIAVRYRYVAR